MTGHTEDALIGRTLDGGKVEITGFLGKGGFAYVYRGRQLSPPREVAIKVLRPDLSRDEDLVARFCQEADLIGRLRHNNVIAIYSSGTEEELYYYVMDLHPRNLAEELGQHGRLSVAPWLRISKDIAAALDHASTTIQGFVHQDIKPGNILLDQAGNAVLTDFGLARGRDLRDATVDAMTLRYMSPEQLYDQEADHRSDIYSFGIVMYEMITGQIPAEHLSKDPVAPSKRVTDLPSKAARGIDKIVLKAMEKEPERRYSSARNILNDLEHIEMDRGELPPFVRTIILIVIILAIIVVGSLTGAFIVSKWLL